MGTVVFDQSGLVAEAKKNFRSRIGPKYSDDDLIKTWNGIFDVIKDQLMKQRGADLAGFGTFNFSQIKMNIAQQAVLCSRQPIFRLCPKLADYYRIQSCQVFRDGDLTCYPVNLATVAQQLGMDRRVVEWCTAEVLSALARALSQGKDVEFPVPGMCKVQIRNKRLKTIFLRSFENKLPIYHIPEERKKDAERIAQIEADGIANRDKQRAAGRERKPKVVKKEKKPVKATTPKAVPCGPTTCKAFMASAGDNEASQEEGGSGPCVPNTCPKFNPASGDVQRTSRRLERDTLCLNDPKNKSAVPDNFVGKNIWCRKGDEEKQAPFIKACFPGTNHPINPAPPHKTSVFSESMMKPMQSITDLEQVLADCEDLKGRRLCVRCSRRMGCNARAAWTQEHSVKQHEDMDAYHREALPLQPDFAGELAACRRKQATEQAKFNYDKGQKEREERFKKDTTSLPMSDVFHARPATPKGFENARFLKDVEEMKKQLSDKNAKQLKDAEDLMSREKAERENLISELKADMEAARKHEAEEKAKYMASLFKQIAENNAVKQAVKDKELSTPCHEILDPHLLFEKNYESTGAGPAMSKNVALEIQKINMEKAKELHQKAKDDYEKTVKEETEALMRTRQRLRDACQYEKAKNLTLLEDMKSHWEALAKIKKNKPVEKPTISVMDQLFYYNRCFRCKKKVSYDGKGNFWKGHYPLDGHPYIE